MKACTKCKQVKPLTEFRNRYDGKTFRCKACLRYSDAESKRKSAIDAICIVCGKTFKARASEVRASGKALYCSRRCLGIRNPSFLKRKWFHQGKNRSMKKSAKAAVAWAKKTGKIIVGPCEWCGSAGSNHGHHDDYSKPLDVRWFCEKHHSDYHAGKIYTPSAYCLNEQRHGG